MKKKNNETEPVTIYFPYEIYKDGELVENALTDKDFEEEDLKAVA